MTQAEAIPTEDELVRDFTNRLGQDSFGTGPLAELRRMDPRQPAAAPPALHRLLARVPDELSHGQQFICSPLPRQNAIAAVSHSARRYSLPAIPTDG